VVEDGGGQGGSHCFGCRRLNAPWWAELGAMRASPIAASHPGGERTPHGVRPHP